MDEMVKLKKDRSCERVLRTLLACVASLVAGLQLWLSVRDARENGNSFALGVADYLRFFSTLTNIFIAFVAIAPNVQIRFRGFRWFATPTAAGCAATSGVLVCAGYHFLLRGSLQGLQGFSDLLLHYVAPAIMVVYAFHILRANRLPWRAPLLWGMYPVAYFIYVLTRGALTGSYPYWFMNVPAIGYVSTILHAFGLLGAFLLIGFALIGISHHFGVRDALN